MGNDTPRPAPIAPQAYGKAGVARKAFDQFTLDRVRRNVLIICVLLIVNKLGTPGNLLCYSVLFAWAIKSPAGAVKAVSINGLLIMASSFFVTRGGLVGPLKYLLLFAAGLTILRYSRNLFGRSYLVLLFLFGVVATLLSLYNGYYVAVSLLKVASFIFGAFCLLNVAQVRHYLSSEMLEWGFSLVLAVVLLSFGALVIGAGYGSYESIWGFSYSGYRGVFSHPQSLGVAAGLMATYITGLLLFVEFPHRRLATALLLGLLILVYLSQARTGMYAYILATGITLVLVRLGRIPRAEQQLLNRYMTRFTGMAVVGLMVLIMLEVVTGAVSDRAVRFIDKGDQFESLGTAAVLHSREQQRNMAWEHFQDNPWTGIGFGTDLSLEWQSKATLLSASTEKGFLPTAILEEVGIMGTTVFVLFLLAFYKSLLHTRAYFALAGFTGFLMVNMGEMVFFAFGGLGMLCWSLIGMSLAVGNNRVQELRYR